MIERAAVLSLALLACACEPASQSTTESRAAPVTTSATTTVAAPTGATVTASAPGTAKTPSSTPAMDAKGFATLVERLSEPDADFFSDNYISNETSYLQVAATLAGRAKGGAYVGVGPEQNFTYIALMEPEMAYIVDIRRDNLVLHLLYKAAFERASSRAHFLALLTGREYAGDDGLAKDASIDEVMAHAERAKATEESFERVHDALAKHIVQSDGVTLDEKDRRTLRRSHRAFFSGGLDIRFSLKGQSFRKYPSLRELAGQTDPTGEQSGFLASAAKFRIVQRMQRENRIVPLVGDFAGDRAMPALAAHMKGHGQTLRGLYVSNVEQYLMVDGKWWKWQKNVAAFPIDEHSLFIRCYLDQGKAHPSQMSGHRTTTTLHGIAEFNARKKPYPSMLALATENALALK